MRGEPEGRARPFAAEDIMGGESEGTLAAVDPSRRHGVTGRALIISALLLPLNVFFIHGFVWVYYDFNGWLPLFTNTVGGIFLGSLLNQLLKRWRPGWAFAPGELLTIYVLLGISTGLTSVSMSVNTSLAGVISYPFWFATPENEWQTLLWPHLPWWLTVSDRSVIEGFFVGDTTPYTWSIIAAWLTPALWWTTFVSVLLWVTLCLNAIVRRRWADEDKLAFPFVAVPVHVADERLGLFRSKAFWVGFLVCVGMEAWNTAGCYLSELPHLSFRYALVGPGATNPWDKLTVSMVNFGPITLGLIYLMPLDMTLSLFFFDLLWNVEYVTSGHLGWNVAGAAGFPYGAHQSVGGFLAFTAAFLWLDRRYSLQVLRRVVGLRSVLADDRNEGLSYRMAGVGAVVGTGYLYWFLTRMGMSGWLAVPFLGLYYVMALGISRLRAQVGPPNHLLDGAGPAVLTGLLGTKSLGSRNLGVLGLLAPYTVGQHSNPIPIQLEALKMSEDGRMNRRRLSLAMALSVPLTMLCYFWASLHYGYDLGLSANCPNADFRATISGLVTETVYDIREPVGVKSGEIFAMSFGFLFVLVLMWARMHVIWFPIHPAAFPLTFYFDMQECMLALLLIWLFKLLILRFLGLRGHRAVLPFFIGLLVGGMTAGLVHGVLYRTVGLPVQRGFGLTW